MYNGAENGKEISKTNQTTEKAETIKRYEIWSNSGRRGISVFNDNGTTKQLSAIVKKNKTAEEEENIIWLESTK